MTGTGSRFALAATLAVAFTLVGCARLEVHHVLTGTPGAPYSGPVRVVLEGQADPPGVEEVAIVQAVGTLGHANIEDLVPALTQEAQSLGCNIVLHVHVDQGSSMATASGVAGRLTAVQSAAPH